MNRYDTLLWDNDGVLVATEHLYLQANREVLSDVGVALSDEEFAHISLSVGNSVLDLAGHLDQAQLVLLRERRNRRYRQLLTATDVSLPGVRETLETLREHYRMAIVTSSLAEHFVAAHAGAGLTPHFEFILTREDYRRSKPDPEPYLCAQRRIGTTSGRCLVIEDSPRGLRAARRAGLDCAVIPAAPFSARDFPGATAVLNKVSDLPAFLLGP